MSDLSSKTCCVIDHGLFLPLAQRLSKDFSRVLYHTPWEDGFARLNRCIIGDGFDNIIRCDHPWDHASGIDLWVFPDIYHADWQSELLRQGEKVWGSRDGDELEINRHKFMRVLGEVGLNVPPFTKVTGITALREHLKDKENKFIKVSKFRGSFETSHWVSWEQSNGDLDSWAVEFGAAKELIRFLVFDPIGEDLEIGCDLLCVRGQWLSLALRGDEWKDKSYVGAVTSLTDLPEPIQDVLSRLSPVLQHFGYCNQFSMELRGEGDKWYFIDATCRGGLPSTASQLNMMTNFSEVVWAGAHGELLQPEYSHDFSVECALTMKGEKGAWRKAVVPDTLQDVMKLGSCCQINGAVCWPPDECHEEEIGWLQASGNSIKEAIETIKDYASKLPDGVSAKAETLVDLLKEIHKAEEEGVPFTEKLVPEPEVAIA